MDENVVYPLSFVMDYSGTKAFGRFPSRVEIPARGRYRESAVEGSAPEGAVSSICELPHGTAAGIKLAIFSVSAPVIVPAALGTLST